MLILQTVPSLLTGCIHLDLLSLFIDTGNEKEGSQGEGGQVELCKAIGNSYQVQIQQERAPWKEKESTLREYVT